MNYHDFNNRLMTLWERIPEQSRNRRVPLFAEELKQDRLLFIGINPSFSARGFKQVLGKQIDINSFYAFPPPSGFRFADYVDNESGARGNHPYFKRFKEIAEDVDVEWEHIDLFFVRETSQSALKKMILINKTGTKLTEFGQEQIKMSWELVRESRPRAIVVANAFGGRLVKDHWEGLTYSEEAGHYFFPMGERTVPVFLTSMLTGQRALDSHSFELLKWHIKKVLSNEV